MSDCQEPPAKRQRACEADQFYFQSYGDLYVHEEMLRDVQRTSAYRDAIMDNKHLIRDKVVLDVGAGTGILSCFCAQAGAKKVYAIEGSDVAEHARRVVECNKLTDCITVIHQMVEECQLPEKVDVIVSEWMGYCLMYESMLSSVLYARDQWLKPDGVMFPSSASVFVAPVTLQRLWDERVNLWSDMKGLYGVDMSCLQEVVQKTTLRSIQVVELHGEDVLADSSCLFSLDLRNTTPLELEKLEGSFSLQSHCATSMHGIGVWFVVTFPGKPPIRLSTSPYNPSTHWRQCVLFFDSPVAVDQDDVIEGKLTMTPYGSHKRFLNALMSCRVPGKTDLLEKEFVLNDNTC